MKCIKKHGEKVKRVSDEQAIEMVASKKGWTYCPKSDWKAQRDAKS